ncbi:hypothetical protein TIFTF001_022349 [Ficus carica]|uniref:Uncharacterized protein n=1 Tax=Ficus carica TaxID=3494 RepID=A0AA88DJZ3_FICCA|nr:hypothetical protein TIFTF001_022349 [Ficus carica]
MLRVRDWKSIPALTPLPSLDPCEGFATLTRFNKIYPRGGRAYSSVPVVRKHCYLEMEWRGLLRQISIAAAADWCPSVIVALKGKDS